jgi:hypothetical protein
MTPEEQYRELLRRVQQKAETYREEKQEAENFQTELEAVKEVYGLTDSEMQEILHDVESELHREGPLPPPPTPETESQRRLALNVASLCLLLVGMALLFLAPMMGIVFLGGIFALRWYN